MEIFSGRLFPILEKTNTLLGSKSNGIFKSFGFAEKRIMAIAFAAIALVAACFLVIPELLSKNISAFKNGLAWHDIAKMNRVFFSLVLLGVIAPCAAIIAHEYVYHTLNMHTLFANENVEMQQLTVINE
jgi:hypothetical protein